MPGQHSSEDSKLRHGGEPLATGLDLTGSRIESHTFRTDVLSNRSVDGRMDDKNFSEMQLQFQKFSHQSILGTGSQKAMLAHHGPNRAKMTIKSSITSGFRRTHSPNLHRTIERTTSNQVIAHHSNSPDSFLQTNTKYLFVKKLTLGYLDRPFPNIYDESTR